MTKTKTIVQKKSKKKPKAEFDKYDYYLRSVQSPETDVEFLRDTFKELKKRDPKTLVEDFCGTFSICCEWVKLGKDKKAVGIDLDTEPLEYGLEHHLTQLSKDQVKRITIKNDNVMNENLPKAELVSAMNFSYFLFKTRKDLKKYFESAYKRTKRDGLFIIDAFGGPECMIENEEVTEHKDFNYYWDQDSFDPITNFAQFYIHFKRPGEKKREKVFSYDWRMWSIPELRDLLEEVGFKKTHVYWEGDDEDGDGDGEFTRVETGEEVDAWVAYIACEK